MANAVTADHHNSQKPITSYDELLSLFHESIKPQEKFRVGAEMEKFGVFANGDPVPYDGDNGVLALMKELAATGGWKTEAESEGGPLLALMRDGASITLEPGSQFELSGAPLEHVPPRSAPSSAGTSPTCSRSRSATASSGSASASIRSRRASSSRWCRSSATRSCASTCPRAAASRST